MDEGRPSVVRSYRRRTYSRQPRQSASCSQTIAGRKKPPQHPFELTLPNTCSFCGAKIFQNESSNICCSQGEIKLSSNLVPDCLYRLFISTDNDSINFRKYILLYNSQFAFTSFGVKKDRELARRDRGIYTFRVQGQVYHYINDFLPNNNEPKYLQLYFYDTDTEFYYRQHISADLSPTVINLLMRIMEVNPYAAFFRSLRDIGVDENSQIIIRSDPNQDQRTHNAPTVSQVAAIWIEDGRTTEGLTRDITVRATSDTSHRILHYYGCYDPLQYPILFPRGDTGWHQNIKRYRNDIRQHEESLTFPINEVLVQTVDDLIEAEEQARTSTRSVNKKVSCREYYCYKLQIRNNDGSILLRCGRLLQQYVVDMYIKIESGRLNFVRNNQDTIRAELYQGIVDSVRLGESDAANVGHRFVLPPSFIGGPRDMQRRYYDAMALVQHFGKPDIFLTITCNPSWSEIKDELAPYEEAQNRPDLLTRVFRAKLMELKKDIFTKKLFGPVAAFVYVVEFQKRGLPHAHFLLILETPYRIRSPDQYDAHVSAEIADPIENLHLHEAVLRHMMHGPCGAANPRNVCMRNGNCKNHYPRAFTETTTTGRNCYPIYKRPNNGKEARIRGVVLDNRWVIPYNPFLLAKYDCHLNVEICSTIKAVKYLYKYIYKGHDRVQLALQAGEERQPTDEILLYQSARWISPPEACWRIYRFLLNDMYPNVVDLQVHLPNMQTVCFREYDNLDNVVGQPRTRKTMLTAFFEQNRFNPQARQYLYPQFPQYFVWHSAGSERFWQPRQRGTAVGRLVNASPTEGERFYLRLLLANVRGPTSFEDLRTVDGILYTSFQEAAYQLGFLEADNSFEECLEEAIQCHMPHVLRRLFATLLIYCRPNSPLTLWNRFYPALSEDFARSFPTNLRKVRKMTIKSVSRFVESMGKKFSDFNLQALHIDEDLEETIAKEIDEERNIPVSVEEVATAELLNAEQKSAFNIIYNRAMRDQSGAFFIDGPGGTGKTFLYSALLANIRIKGYIALAVATSGIAASNMSGGRTANSRFKIPLDVDEHHNINISKQSALATLIRQARLIIWDEASMARRQAVELFEKMLRDICSDELPYGGKLVVFGGDFRQVLPVIPKSSVQEAIDSSLVMSPLWQGLRKLHLMQNMRAIHDPAFCDFVLGVGDGVPPYDDGKKVSLPTSILIHPEVNVPVSSQLIDAIFPEIYIENADPTAITRRAILTPTNEDAYTINSYLIARHPGIAHEYKSFDTAADDSAEPYPVEFLNTLTPNGLPPHHLVLKKTARSFYFVT